MTDYSEIIKSLIIGAGSSAIILLFVKKWILKELDHLFYKRIEEYKSELDKGNISFQIEKTEFAKKKFEYVTNLYAQLLSRKKRADEIYQFIGYQRFIDIRKAYDAQLLLDGKLENEISLASLYVDETVSKEITQFMTCCHILMLEIIAAAEDKVSKIPTEHQYVNYKVVGHANGFDKEANGKSINDTRKQLGKHFDNITNLFKAYLSVK